ncbi:MAG: J domain-containing protein [Chloroflexota bacterium]
MTVSIEDLYRTLQVAPGADLETIRAAYRRLARLYHPDLNPRPEAAARMRAINAAYAVLSDPARRATYDARRYLPRSQVVHAARPVQVHPVMSVPQPPTPLQHRVDRIVAILGIGLLVGIGFYAVNVVPYAAQQSQFQRPASAPSPGATLAQAPTLDPASGVSVPERLRADAALKSFPGPVLVAPAGLEPFASLPVVHTESASRGIARYAIYYSDLTSGAATISGLLGRESFDTGATRLPDCSPDGTYCSGPVPGQPAGPAGLELFRTPGLVGDLPAYATHRVCCNGVFWSLSWYEPRANMSYSLEVSRSAAAQFGRSVAEANVDAARAFAALASGLVRLP